MASKVYPKWKEAVMQASSDSSLGGTVKAVLVDVGTYTYADTHDFYNDLSGVAQSSGADATITINNKSFTNGVFKTSDTSDTFTALTTSATTYEALVVFIDTGTPSTSRLVAYIDGFSAFTPNGGDAVLNWDQVTDIDPTSTSASGIFSL
jgi:hypothetical protein